MLWLSRQKRFPRPLWPRLYVVYASASGHLGKRSSLSAATGLTELPRRTMGRRAVCTRERFIRSLTRRVYRASRLCMQHSRRHDAARALGCGGGEERSLVKATSQETRYRKNAKERTRYV